MDVVDRWERLEALLEEVLPLAPDAAERRLEALAGDDAALFAEARALLRASRAAEGGLPVPGGATVGAWLGGGDGDGMAERLAGVTVDGFEIVRELGHGGMGVVFEARQHEPARRVALKMLRMGLESQAARSRFAAEARILANLSHPGIAALYDVGTWTGAGGFATPYLVMELVEGARTVTAYAREVLEDLDARIALFVEVARAVAAGHQRGIIHRDLKPANVLVDHRGRPKIIDFGIARVTAPDLADPVAATRTGVVLGTLGYIAPEQLAGNSAPDDVRMDVYALGVLFQEMVTGRPPIDLRGMDLVRSLRAIRHDPPTPARRQDPTLPPDLALILAKGIEKEPSRRYASVDALLADVEAFRRDAPISARPASFTYQLRLFTRRNRAAVLAAAAVVVALGAAAGFSLTAARSEAAQRQVAEQASRRARGMLLGSQAVLASVLRDFYADLAAVPGSLAARRSLVEKVERGLAEIRLHAVDDPELLLMAADLQLRLGRLRYDQGQPHLGQPREAARAYARALALYERLDPPGRRPRAPDALLGRVASLTGLADVAQALGDTERAAERLDAARDLLEALGPAGAEEARVALARANHRLRRAMLLDRLERKEEAERLLGTALAELPPVEDDVPQAAARARTRGLLGALLAELRLLAGDPDGARPALETAQGDLEAYARRSGDPPDAWKQRALLATHLGDLALQEGDGEAALEAFRRALELDERVLALEPQDRAALRAVQVDHAKLAQAHDASGNLPEAIAAQRRAAQLAEAAMDASPEDLELQLNLRITWNLLGGMLVRGRFVDEGARVFERAYALARQVDAAHPQHPGARLALAEALDGMGIARYFQSGLPDADRAALLQEGIDFFTRSREAHRRLAVEGLLPPTHAEAEGRIAQKVSVLEDELGRFPPSAAPAR